MARPNFSHLLTHSIRNRCFRLFWKRPSRKDEGSCDFHNRKLWIHPNSDHLETLGTTIHECLHAAFFDLEDSAVVKFEEDLVRLLRRMKIKVTFEP